MERRRRVLVAVVAAATALVGCSSDDAPAAPSAFDRMVAAAQPGQWRANQDDVVEVWVCRVPTGTTSSVYGELPLRLPLDADTLASLFQQQVSRYFHTVSFRVYTPSFVPGGDVQLGPADGPDECAEQALDRSGPEATVVLAVADAEHVEGELGGQGSGGVAAAEGSPAKVSRRVAYVGGSDFNRVTWGDNPPLDLVEHELGHTLGWVHSGVTADGRYVSALDVMSNSAAPREVRPERRDAPDAIAIQRVIAGWIPADEVVQATGDSTEVTLSPSTDNAHRETTRLLVLPVDDRHFLTVERLQNDDYNDHLPAAGIAVHRVTLGDDDLPTAVEPLVGEAPFTALLEQDATLETDGWTITVTPDGAVVRPSSD